MMARRWEPWGWKEVNVLLDIMERTPDLGVLMRSTSQPKRHIYRDISHLLGQKGFPRTTEQVSSKIKILRIAFYRAMDHHDGKPPRHAMPPFFKRLHRLWEQAGSPSWEAMRRGFACEWDIKAEAEQAAEELSGSSVQRDSVCELYVKAKPEEAAEELAGSLEEPSYGSPPEQAGPPATETAAEESDAHRSTCDNIQDKPALPEQPIPAPDAARGELGALLQTLCNVLEVLVQKVEHFDSVVDRFDRHISTLETSVDRISM